MAQIIAPTTMVRVSLAMESLHRMRVVCQVTRAFFSRFAEQTKLSAPIVVANSRGLQSERTVQEKSGF